MNKKILQLVLQSLEEKKLEFTDYDYNEYSELVQIFDEETEFYDLSGEILIEANVKAEYYTERDYLDILHISINSVCWDGVLYEPNQEQKHTIIKALKKIIY